MMTFILQITFRQLREGARLTVEECFRMEYRISQRFMVPRSQLDTTARPDCLLLAEGH